MPLVSIGLPVFNGDRYLAETIASVLGQTLGDLELIVCDNASTDATPDIVAAAAARDPRVRSLRNPRNLGAGPNYDRAFHAATGRYFKWAAHDDLLAPDWLARAVAALEAAPEAVLCTVGITEIGPEGEVLRHYANRFPGIAAPDPATRLGGVIHTRHQCEDFFSVMRREALGRTGLHGTYPGSDRVLLAEMALLGPWVAVDAPLFLHREHPHRYTRALLLRDRRAAALWQDSTGASARAGTHFHWTVWRQYGRAVARHVADPARRLACRRELARWWLTDGHAADVARDALRAASPRLFAAVRGAKRAVLGHGRGPARSGELPPAEQG